MDEDVIVQDPSGMLEKINDLPIQLEKAWAGLWTQNLPINLKNFNHILIVGMGGSGIAGILAKDFAQQSVIPVSVWSDYQLPNWVNEKTLVIAVSYSGDTEETLDAVSCAVTKKATIFAITCGGKLSELASKHGFPLLRINYQSAPRSAVGFLYGSVLTLFAKLGVVKLAEADYLKAINEIKLQVKDGKFREQAKQLAISINNKLPVIISYAPLTGVGYRWSTQLNENSSSFAYSVNIPEMSHNFIAGLDFPYPEKMIGILLTSKYAFSRNVARTKIILEVLSKKEFSVIPLELKSGSMLSEQMLFVFFGDLVSYYLSGIYGVDPTPVEPIQFLKEGLSKKI